MRYFTLLLCTLFFCFATNSADAQTRGRQPSIQKKTYETVPKTSTTNRTYQPISPLTIQQEDSDNPSEILFRSLQTPVKALEDLPSMEGAKTGRTIQFSKQTSTISKTISANAIPQIAADLPLARTMSGSFDSACTEPDIVIPESDCCSYTIQDQKNSKNVAYRQPKHVFGDEASARNFAASVKASLPIYLPYKESSVYAGQGWHYDSGSFHGAVDYSKTANSYGSGIDPTFMVYSVADGVVVTVTWLDLMGNVVVVEHTAPNGDKYRSAYIHVRNGFDHDLQKAKNIAISDPNDANARDVKYKKFANLSNPSTLLWGTNSQTIKVKVGDKVSAGQLIGYSGNTGYGGAGWGLNTNGTPTNANTANNHLHFMMCVPDPRPSNPSDWVQVDPYGVYETVGEHKECYDLLSDTPYNRLFAPFYPSFHNVPAEYVSHYWAYYTGMGMALQTLSIHRKGNQLLASGSFQWGLSNQWYARFFMTGADFQKYFNEYHNKGFRPRQIDVTNDNSGNARYTVIWQKRGNEVYYTYFGLTDNGFSEKWDDLVKNKKYRVEEHVIYTDNGQTRHAAIFVNTNSGGFYAYHNMTANSFNDKFDELHKKGFMLHSMHAASIGGQTKYDGVWLPRNQSYYAYYGLTPSAYQQKFTQLTQQGYHLHKIQGYENSGKFAAIWVK
ncbi:MAG: hypothetical protein R3E32_03975 [Chitinophagales bacterium]